MPTKDGFTVCEQLKGDLQLSEIPVLIMTSFAAKKQETNIPVSAGLTLEAEDYIDKPVKPDELLNRVEKLLKTVGF
jgi:CheY-like chemotaxis protein